MFAITDCHVQGDLCWYPGQAYASSSSSSDNEAPHPPLCHPETCAPVLEVPETGGAPDFPIDEYHLGLAFAKNRKAGETWLNVHLENFMNQTDIQALADAGITHVRVPLPHWILGDRIDAEEPYLTGNRWDTFLQLCDWARQAGLQVWPDLHTAPGSQNGFDNSGHALSWITCRNWSDHAERVKRTLRIVHQITQRIATTPTVRDVVTGFGILNEPFKDCNRNVFESYIDEATKIVRNNLGADTAVYFSDMFLAPTFNKAQFGSHTHDWYLDSHYYHVFDNEPRILSPRQHIAYVCQKEYRDASSCCYQDPPPHSSSFASFLNRFTSWIPWHIHRHVPSNQIPNPNVQRIIGEWSLAYDTLPVPKLQQVMQGIAQHGIAPEWDRLPNPYQIDFLRHFAMAQMVVYEDETITSAGWFFWTAKTEGGAFLEWDFLRAVRNGWIPSLPKESYTSTRQLYGTCYDILFQTDDEHPEQVIHPFPDPETVPFQPWSATVDDDIVLSHGQTLRMPDGKYRQRQDDLNDEANAANNHHIPIWARGILYALVAVVLFQFVKKKQSALRRLVRRHKATQYTPIPDDDDDDNGIENTISERQERYHTSSSIEFL
jgi:glucan 1,3-beta-glucosidase